EDDIVTLKKQGVGEIFGPGSSLGDIAKWLELALDARE
ncbi:MAG: methylmalonyl-CoA mutase, partial [Acidimicrobiia bacterium]|nr:methylmalonyl-CoA mutase [Acidimicrobiia bacterium]